MATYYLSLWLLCFLHSNTFKTTMSYNGETPPTIDDEFASLFLKPMIVTPSTRHIQHRQNHELSQSLQETDPTHSEFEYLNSIDFQHHNDGINIGLPNYSKHLPVETTLSNNLFDFPEIGYINAVQSSSLTPTLSENYKSNSDLAMHFHSLQGFNQTATSKRNMNFNNPTLEGQIQPQVKRKKISISSSSSHISQILLFHVANRMLKLESTESNTIDLLHKNRSKVRLDFDSRLSGRLFVSSNIFEMPTDDLIKNSTLYGYRRNSITVSFKIKIIHFESEDQGLYINLDSKNDKFCNKIIFELYTSLRKVDSKLNPPQTIQLDERIEFDFVRDNESVKGNKVCIRQARYEIDTESLKNENEIDLVWDQIRFASATASNKHDATKFNVIICQVSFIDEDGKIISIKKFESNPIVSRGRNPSFYNDRNEIMIGKIKENSNPQSVAVTQRTFENESDKERTSESPQSTTIVEKSFLEEVLENTLPVKTNNQPTLHKVTKSESQPASNSSSYTYFKVDEHYYLPPVDVGYFPHHVHHNKQVFTSVISTGKNQNGKTHKYNYYI